MTRDKLVMLLVGAALYYGYLKFTGVVSGAPWKPTAAKSASN